MYGWACIDRWIDGWIECLGRDVNRMVCGDGMVWGGWARKGDGGDGNWDGVKL